MKEIPLFYDNFTKFSEFTEKIQMVHFESVSIAWVFFGSLDF